MTKFRQTPTQLCSILLHDLQALVFCLRRLEILKKVRYCFINGDADPVIAWLASVYKCPVIRDDSDNNGVPGVI